MNKNKKTTKIVLTSVPVVPATAATSVTFGPLNRNTARNRKKRARRASKRRGLVSIGRGLKLSSVGASWLQSLNNPFEFAPMPLGLDTMYPTRVVTAYYRNQFSANADGSIQVWLSPNQFAMSSTSAGAFISVDTAGVNTTPTFSNAVAATDSSVITNQFDQFRVLSAGLRVIPLQAMTSSMGITASAVYPQDSSGSIRNCTGAGGINAQVLVTYPHMDWGRTFEPVEIRWRPAELLQLGQFLSCSATIGTNQSGLAPACVFVCTGGAASANYAIEGIAHLECYDVSKGASAFGNTMPGNDDPGVETSGGLWNQVKQFLKPAVDATYDYASAGVQTAAQLSLGLGAQYAKRKLFSKGSSFSSFSGRGNTIMESLIDDFKMV